MAQSDGVDTTVHTGPRSLIDTRWFLTEVRDGDEVLLDRPGGAGTPLLIGAQTMSGNDGCNQFSGAIEVDNETIHVVGPIASTRMACAGPVPDAMQALFHSPSIAYVIAGDELVLTTAGSATTLTYVALDTPFAPADGVVVDEGSDAGVAYRLVWHHGLDLETVGSDGATGVFGSGPDPGRVNAMRVPVGDHEYVFAVVPATARKVVYQPVGEPEQELEIHDVGDADFAVVGALVEPTSDGWGVVAYDEHGDVIHRVDWAATTTT